MAIIDDKYAAAVFPDEIFQKLRIGDRRPALIKRIREDGKVSLSLSPQGYEAIAAESPRILTMFPLGLPGFEQWPDSVNHHGFSIKLSPRWEDYECYALRLCSFFLSAC